jgi:acetyl-CoA synthetase
MEIESALVDHPDVAEAAVVGSVDSIKGTAVVAFVTVKLGVATSTSLEADLKQHVVHKIGSIARPQRIIFSGDLPKTRSGKIMRRLLRDIAACCACSATPQRWPTPTWSRVSASGTKSARRPDGVRTSWLVKSTHRGDQIGRSCSRLGMRRD